VDRIPSLYIINRWRRDVLPRRIYSLEYRYGVDNTPQSVLRNEILDLVTDCVDVLRNDADALSDFANQLKSIKGQLSEKRSHVQEGNNATKDSEFEELIGQQVDVEVEVNNPDAVRFKGCGRVRRYVANSEPSTEKPPKAPRHCKTCDKFVTDHDSRNCAKIKNKKKKKQKVVAVENPGGSSTDD
jgi:hypothetical protein